MTDTVRRRYKPGEFELAVKRSSAGLGLFAASPIPKGACVIEYIGRQISREEMYTSNSRYLFEINSRKTIDGAPRWNTAPTTAPVRLPRPPMTTAISRYLSTAASPSSSAVPCSGGKAAGAGVWTWLKGFCVPDGPR